MWEYMYCTGAGSLLLRVAIWVGILTAIASLSSETDATIGKSINNLTVRKGSSLASSCCNGGRPVGGVGAVAAGERRPLGEANGGAGRGRGGARGRGVRGRHLGVDPDGPRTAETGELCAGT